MSIESHGSAGGNYGNYGNLNSGGTQGTTNTFKGFVDGSSSLGGSQKVQSYEKEMNVPQLTAVSLGKSDDANGHHYNPIFTPTHAFYESVSENLEQLVDKHGLNEEQANDIIFSHMAEVPCDDTFCNQLVGELDAMVAGDMAELFELPSTSDQSKNLKKEGGSFVSSSREQIDSLQQYADSLPEGPEKQAIQEKISEMKQGLEGFNTALNSLGDNPSREELANLANELAKGGDNLKELAGQLGTLAGNDPTLRNLIANVNSQLASSASTLNSVASELVLSNEISQGNFSGLGDSFKNTFMGTLSKAFDKAFEGELEGLDVETQAQLRFAHNNPDADGISQETKNLLAQLEGGAVSQLQAKEWGIPEGYTPPVNSDVFNARLQNTADALFEEALAGFVGEDGEPLSPEQQAIVKNMYYGTVAAGGDLGAISAELEAQVAAELVIAMGVPDGFPVPKGSLSHNANINGQFMQQFMALLSGLSPEQKAKVMQAISDPLNPAISNETKQLLQELFNEATGTIQGKFGLPKGWSPPVSILKDITNVSPRHITANTAISDTETEVALAISYIEAWPNSPTKSLILNVLKIVSDAISGLKAQLAIMMQLDTELSKKIAQAQLDTALTKVAANLKKLKEIEEKQKKMASMGPLMKIFKVFAVILTAFLVMFSGPIGFILMGTMLNDMISEGDFFTEESTIGKMFDMVFEVISELFSFLPDPLNEIMGTMAQIALIIGAVSAGVNPFLAMQVFFESSGIIQTFFEEVCGCDPMVGEMMAMGIQMVAEIIAMILMTIVTGGAGGALLVTAVTARVAQAVAKAAQSIARVVTMIAQTLTRIADAMQGSLRIVGQVMQSVASQLTKFAGTLANTAQKLQTWATKMTNLASQINRMSKHVKMTTQVKATLSRGGKTGHMGFDVAMKAFRKQIDLVKNIYRVFAATVFVVQMETTVITINNQVVAAQISRIRGELEAMMTELESFIQVLKKMLAKLLEGLTSMGGWMAQIGQSQGSMWKEMSETLDAVAGANQAA